MVRDPAVTRVVATDTIGGNPDTIRHDPSTCIQAAGDEDTSHPARRALLRAGMGVRRHPAACDDDDARAGAARAITSRSARPTPARQPRTRGPDDAAMDRGRAT